MLNIALKNNLPADIGKDSEKGNKNKKVELVLLKINLKKALAYLSRRKRREYQYSCLDTEKSGKRTPIKGKG